MMPVFCFIIPTAIPVYFWNESFVNSWFVVAMFRYCFVLNVTWLVNSAAHKFGGKPYDRYAFKSKNLILINLNFADSLILQKICQ